MEDNSVRRVPSSHDNFKPLSWTTDPVVAQECFSDWILKVQRQPREERSAAGAGAAVVGGRPDGPTRSNSSTTTTADLTVTAATVTYYVHKVVLAVGPRHSEYFSSLFRCDNVRERHDDTSVLILTDAEADAMPALLNFVYCNHKADDDDEQQQELFQIEEGQKNEQQSIRIIGLCKLGQYLLIPALLSSVATMCGKQLSLESLLNLTAELRNVVDNLEAFYDAAASLLLTQSVLDVEIAHKIHPELLIRAIHKTADESFEMFNDQSILASMEGFKDELTREAFDFLSLGICTRNEPYLPPPPSVRGRTALRLLLLDAHISEGTNSDGTTDHPATLELSRIQEKCVEAITYPTHGRHHSRINNGYAFTIEYSPPEGAEDVLLRLPKNVLVAIISRFAKNQENGEVLRTILEDKALPSR